MKSSQQVLNQIFLISTLFSNQPLWFFATESFKSPMWQKFHFFFYFTWRSVRKIVYTFSEYICSRKRQLSKTRFKRTKHSVTLTKVILLERHLSDDAWRLFHPPIPCVPDRLAAAAEKYLNLSWYQHYVTLLWDSIWGWHVRGVGGVGGKPRVL